MSGKEVELVKNAFDSNWIAPLGPHIYAFEQEMTDYLNNYPKPMFYFKQTIVYYIPAVTKENIREFRKAYKKNRKNPKGFKLDETIKIWKTRKPNVRKTIENMKFYYQGLFIFISRSLLQKSLGIISTKEANIRIKKCQTVLENHFNIMLRENPKDQEASVCAVFYECIGNGKIQNIIPLMIKVIMSIKLFSFHAMSTSAYPKMCRMN